VAIAAWAEQRRDAIRAELKTLATPRRADVRDTSEIRAELVQYLQNWRAMAREGVAEAHRLLRAVLVGRFVFTPVTPPSELPPRKGPGRKPRFIYELKGQASLSGLIAGYFCKFGGGPKGIWHTDVFTPSLPDSATLRGARPHRPIGLTQAVVPTRRLGIRTSSLGA